MNNIEILEELIKKANVEDVDMNDVFYGEHIKAIENLIQENKELKEARDSLLWQRNFDMKILDEDYIPKLKLKEKIEELDKKMAEDEVDEFGIHSQGWAALDWTRDFLLELLEEGE